MVAAKISVSFLVLSILLPLSEQNNSTHINCSPFSCGQITHIKFPFSSTKNPECGLYDIECTGSTAKIQLGVKLYHVNSISDTTNQITVKDSNFTQRLLSGLCDFPTQGSFPRVSPLRYRIPIPVLTLFMCNSSINIPANFKNYSCRDTKLFYTQPWSYAPPGGLTSESSQLDCPASSYPVFEIPGDSEWQNFDLLSTIDRGFVLQWIPSQDCVNCEEIGGFCGSDTNRNFTCYCPEGSDQTSCRRLTPSLKKKVIIISASVGGSLIILAAAVVLFFFHVSGRKFRLSRKIFMVKKKTKKGEKVEKFLKNCGSMLPTRFSYSELKRITTFFKEKLGEGGCSTVFKGELVDGRLVAVKILTESKGDGKDFINEVAAISRTSHVNIVTLLGFCSEGSKRALIYDFMPNGSLEKFIFSKKPGSGNQHLSREMLYKIALGTARGLEYLHRGCNTQILHFDIKPHNILLDRDFSPKISDFGLAKLYPNQASVVSMTVVRGTIGYIAPEVIYRSFGGVSYKSDVYSYGVLLLEMIGGRKNADERAENTSKIYFPDWVYSRLDRQGDLDLELGVLTEEEGELVRKMLLVGLWCIQPKPSNRPSMSRVVEMLQGKSDDFPVPPKPVLCSSPSSEIDEMSLSTLFMHEPCNQDG